MLEEQEKGARKPLQSPEGELILNYEWGGVGWGGSLKARGTGFSSRFLGGFLGGRESGADEVQTSAGQREAKGGGA